MQIAADVTLIIAGLCRDFGARADLRGGSTKPQSIETRSEIKGPVTFLFFSIPAPGFEIYPYVTGHPIAAP